ncbi:hypothetical protein B5M09_002356 [Aphanomyces astaci]|uniref:EF-hand domain-containing protein n=1 Tax=Aphanomyces astaci TaxID=112090 RepID=A0A425DBB1_APHAT|nr:hypothetical protein B5M09_002356 [Aphanomyces astaci]
MNVSHASDDNAAATMNAASQRETIRAAFRAFDEDGSGRIDANELSDLITSLGGVMSSVELQEALRVLDKDGDGVVDQDEFEKWWTSASDDLDGDGRLGQLETALARLKEHGQKRFHVDIHTACWHGHLDVVTRLVEADREIVHAKDTTEFGVHSRYLSNRDDSNRRPPASKPSESLPISGYKIKVTLLLSNEPLTTTLQLVGPHPTTLWLDKLVQDASYTVQVAAVTLHGASDYSIGTVISTLPDILVGD